MEQLLKRAEANQVAAILIDAMRSSDSAMSDYVRKVMFLNSVAPKPIELNVQRKQRVSVVAELRICSGFESGSRIPAQSAAELCQMHSHGYF